MGTSSPNHSFTKAFRARILFFSIFLLLQFTLSFAQDGRDSIQLPPLHTDAEKLAVLLQIKEKVPNLFSDAAKYDIDLFALLEDEEKLLNHLKSNPKYLELFQHKKYHEIQITPPREGIQVGEVSIDPLAIQEWREQLKNSLHQFNLKQGSGDQNTHPMEVLREEISSKVRNIAESNSSVDGNALLKELGKIKANQPVLNSALKESGAKTLSERLSTALKVYHQLPGKLPHISQENLEQALKLEQDREDLKSLIELHSTLGRREQNRDPAHLTWQTAEASLNELHSEDLVTFQDKDDYLSPIVKHLIPSSYPGLQEGMLNGIHKTISSFANRTISSEKKAIDPVTISQQHPIIGIFRGCTGGDCSSQYSFPYPNDPNEKVFFILDKEKKVKGYVSATQVLANGKPSLYVITVSGNRVTSADTELILRGLEKEKTKLGVEQILLPAPTNVESLINFPAPRSIYDRYTAHQPTVEIHYNHPEIRNDIQLYESDRGYNEGHYDHMERNRQAVVLSFKKNSGNEKIITQTHELPTTALQVPSLNSTHKSEVFKFLLDLNRSGRHELERKILQIDQVKESLSPNKYRELNDILSRGPSQDPITVQQFKALLTNKLSEVHGSLSHYLENNPSLAYPAILSCSDIFSLENRDETAKYVIKHIKETKGDPFPKNSEWSKVIEDHSVELNNTESVQKFKKDMLNHLQDANTHAKESAIASLAAIKANDVTIHSALLHTALSDSNGLVRKAAFSALSEIKPKVPNIQLQILHAAIHNSDDNIRKSALDLLGSIKPSDPSIHAQILQTALSDPNYEIRRSAFNTLEGIKPSDPSIHMQILNTALSDPDKYIRKSALNALEGIKPSDPSIHMQILNTALSDPDDDIRKSAFNTLRGIKPSDPNVHLEILKIALHNSNQTIKSSALDLLKTIQPTDPNLHLQILHIALQDSDSRRRRSALDILRLIQPADPKIHLDISQIALNDLDNNVREMALRALGAIKPADQKIHLDISQIALNDPNNNVREMALRALGAIKPADPNVHLNILKAARDDSTNFVRISALRALEVIKPADPKIHLAISKIVYLAPDKALKESALQALSAIKPADPNVHLNVLKALSDPKDEVKVAVLKTLGEINPSDPKIYLGILKIAQGINTNLRVRALDALEKIKPTDPNIHFGISEILQDRLDDGLKINILRALATVKSEDPKIHSTICKFALHDPNIDVREMALRALTIPKSSNPELHRVLLQIAIDQTNPEERTLAIKALTEADFANPLVRENLREEILQNSDQLKNRQDLLPIIHKFILPASLQATNHETHCQSLNDILSHDKNLKSLMEFFSDHSGILGVSRSFPGKIGQDTDLPPVPPTVRKTHAHPPLAPGW